jgi:hypothetical protein
MIDYICVLYCSKTIAWKYVTAVFSKLLHLKDKNITYFTILIGRRKCMKIREK